MTDKTWIIDATDESFEKEVLERSKSTLCIVDFWAEWCGPCRMLAPILEELAAEYEGKFTLVKVDADQSQQTAMKFGVQSLPSVFAFADGEAVDGFMGVLPKEQIKEWIDNQLAGNEVFDAINLTESAPEEAIEKLTVLQEKHPEEVMIRIGLADAYFNTGKIEECRAIIAQLEDRGFLEPEAQKIKAKLDMQAKGGIDISEAKSNAEANPDDLNIQLAYANALVGQSRYEEAFEICLGIVQKDKKGVGDEARALMVEVFKSLPDDSELTHVYRRKLSMLLY